VPADVLIVSDWADGCTPGEAMRASATRLVRQCQNHVPASLKTEHPS